MTPEEKAALAEKLGKETAEKIAAASKETEKKAEAIAKEIVEKGAVSKEKFEEYKTASETSLQEIKDIAEKQGMTITELGEKLVGSAVEGKSIAETLEDHKQELQETFMRKTGTVDFMLTMDSAGRMVMKKHDPFKDKLAKETKAAGPHATVGGVGGVGNVASISASLSPAALLRASGVNPAILAAPRNTPWLLDVMNVIRAGYDNPMAIWFEEDGKEGSAAVVPEGEAKPLVQYKYKLRSEMYKKIAHVLSFSQEFSMDFERLQNDILSRGMIDINNLLNGNLLVGVTAAATPYNTAAAFKSGVPVPKVNDFDALIAMKTQVKDSQFGLTPNAALMSAFKEGRMAATKDDNGNYIDRPSYLDDLSFIGNPGMAGDNVIVGDLTNYNVILRGGMLIRIGYNDGDFIRNMFSVVQEQFYYDYIADVRKSAIVKGPTFADVKTAISA